MPNTEVPDENPSPLESLPRTLLSRILDAILLPDHPSRAIGRRGTPADVAALMLASRSLYAAVAGADGVWSRQCAALGWRDGVVANGSPPQQQQQRQRSSPFLVFAARMRTRILVRRRAALLAAYLPRRAAAALERGASPAELAAAEERLGGSPLPPQLWELLRHRDGQSPGPGVALVDDARLLSARELFLEERDLGGVSLAPSSSARSGGDGNIAGAGAAAAVALAERAAGGWEQTGAVHASASAFGGAATAAAAAASQAGPSSEQQQEQQEHRRAKLVVFASNAGGSRMYAVDAGDAADGGGDGGSSGGDGDGGGGERRRRGGGEVYVLRGLMTTRRVAGSVEAFLAKLLCWFFWGLWGDVRRGLGARKGGSTHGLHALSRDCLGLRVIKNAKNAKTPKKTQKLPIQLRLQFRIHLLYWLSRAHTAIGRPLRRNKPSHVFLLCKRDSSSAISLEARFTAVRSS